MRNGDRVKDVITGFQGIVIAEHSYLNGCKRVTVQPEKLADGKMPDAQTFDVEQLTMIKVKVHSLMTPTGGPMIEPRRSTIPARR